MQKSGAVNFAHRLLERHSHLMQRVRCSRWQPAEPHMSDRSLLRRMLRVCRPPAGWDWPEPGSLQLRRERPQPLLLPPGSRPAAGSPLQTGCRKPVVPADIRPPLLVPVCKWTQASDTEKFIATRLSGLNLKKGGNLNGDIGCQMNNGLEMKIAMLMLLKFVSLRDQSVCEAKEWQ